jgi:formylglycine-generating enzyme required for sulfatase activity
MKKHLLTLLTLVCISIQVAMANNIVVSNVNITGQNNALKFKLINFDVAWDNSWNINAGPKNHDAAWIFVKYRLKTDNIWYHATLNWVDGTGATDGHTEPINSDIISSNDNAANGAHGVFIRRTDLAFGSVNFVGTKLRWNYGVDGLADGDNVEVRVMAVEMVNVPQGFFYVGSGGTEVGGVYNYPNPSVPYLINTEAAINVNQFNGSLFYESITYASGDQSGPIPANFPKGFKAFYCMKYEITQAQYVAFLNVLTFTQQDARTEGILANAVVGSPALFGTFRNSIEVKSLVPLIQFGCDLSNDNIYDGLTDGQSIACNFLSFLDIEAYLDWAALRPLTELEFEKVGRGTKYPVGNEYAWGDDYAIGATTISNGGANNEIAQINANAVFGNAVGGPMRVGNFAKLATTMRPQAGASFYGAMDLSGNLWEQTVCIGDYLSTPFYNGKHGNGSLDGNGFANVSGWPVIQLVGFDLLPPKTALRGGDWENLATYCRLSDRSLANYYGDLRLRNTGGRGCRTAPL